MSIKNYATRHPVGLYFSLAFGISWSGGLLLGWPLFFRGGSVELEDIAVMGLLIVAGPCVAGLCMTYLVDGKPGLRDLVSRMTKWRVGGQWYAPLLIFPILIFSISVMLGAWVSPELRPTFFAPGIVMGLIAGSIEEIGWMGFAYPMMRSKQSILRASIYLGIVHALWHIPPDLLAHFNEMGWHWLPYFSGFFVFVVALRVLIVWVYENTGSLLLAQLMHASSTGFYAILISVNIAPVNWAIFSCVYAVVISAAALLVVAKYGRNLTNQEEPAGTG